MIKSSRNIDTESTECSNDSLYTSCKKKELRPNPRTEKYINSKKNNCIKLYKNEGLMCELKRHHPEHSDWKRPDADIYFRDITPEDFTRSIDEEDKVQVVPPGKSVFTCPIYPASKCKIDKDIAPYTMVYSAKKQGRDQNIRYTSYRMGRQDK